MPIFDQGYQHWHGKLSGQAGAVAADHPPWGPRPAQEPMGPLGHDRRLRAAAVARGLPGVWGLFEQKSAFLTPFLFFFQNLPEELRAGPRGYRTPCGPWPSASSSTSSSSSR